jgi:phosphatidylinositol-3,4,5-trisphosphate 3-phosphatase/dual-specificity protein phosphatase PTEN
MRRFPFDDHSAPTLKTVLAFCHNAMTFLKEDHQNVIAVHCKGGKGRTGVMMACLLMWTGHRATALDAIEVLVNVLLYWYKSTNTDANGAPST